MTRNQRASQAPWEPASPGEVAARFAAAGDAPWWIAGGFAIELAVGRRLRDHGDIDVLLLRRDQHIAQRVLPRWQWWAADPPGTLRPWAAGEILPPGVHDVWCRPGPDAPWRIQIMLDESDGPDWVSRRNPRVRMPIGRLGGCSPGGLPFLVPEVQLYYKAGSLRPKDLADFTAALPVLSPTARAWLIDAIPRTYGRAHPWLQPLGAPDGR